MGPKPPGPNRERAETSWGRTGKGPKPLAFISLRDMIKNVPKFGQNIYNLLLCKQRIQETGKLYVHWPEGLLLTQ